MTDRYTELIPTSESDRKKLSKLFRPLNDLVIVAVDTSEEKTPGGILLPDAQNANMQPKSGTVIAHGPGARSPVTGERVALSVSVGDRVLFGQYAGHDIEYGTIVMKSMREPDVLTVVLDDDALQPSCVQVRKPTKAKRKVERKKRTTKKATKKKTRRTSAKVK